MNSVIEKFGRIVDGQLDSHPAAARNLLTTAYRLNGWAGKHIFKKTTPSRLELSDACNQVILRPFDHPQQSAMVSLFTPCELLQAFDLAPLFPEGLASYLSGAGAERGFIEAAEKNGVPETLCSYHKIFLGAAMTGVLPKPRFILNTTLACDANTLSFRRLASYYSVPHMVLDVPMEQDAAAVDYVAGQMKDCARKISLLLHRPLNEDKLRSAVARSGKTVALYQQYLAARAEKSMPDEMSSEMFAVFAMHVLLGTPEALEFAQGVLREAEAAPPKEKNELRLLWVHTLPHMDSAMVDFMDFNPDCQIIATDICFDSPAVTEDTDPWQAMAQRLVQNTLNGPAQRRIDAILQQANRLHPDGIVWFCHWGCRETGGASQMGREQLEKAGFPTLILDGDACDRSNCPPGQMITRMQAFLEMLEEKHDSVHL
ncbi:MAG: 2-hydroxyacyl-CoA dehydratase family protein [Oscillospiraceae bacterium]|jgi:benzoyl-CoA reductase/2-hydroxyglutaryl-CoA dehydratase subunit BcrC/BadD/HgdB|nr:2-hydroxyacyl-CoA dehydratase family protein [Oscillospiraceae bacterium]